MCATEQVNVVDMNQRNSNRVRNRKALFEHFEVFDVRESQQAF